MIWQTRRRSGPHSRSLRLVLAVIKDASGELALDLTKNGMTDKIAAATNKNLIEALFESHGMAY
jgi:type III restriction enzyme